MKKVILGSIATIILSTSTTFAGPNNGCGLGNQIIQNQSSALMQSFGATTNGTSGNQTFGITSGTSGCTKPARFVSSEKVKTFIANNMDQLAMDISAGNGESIDTLATLLKVEDKASFKTELQSNFGSIYSTSDVEAAHVIDSIVAIAG
jgi:hypothetical protein